MDLLFPLQPGKNCHAWAFVGSRVTCDPAPTDTDRDIIVMCCKGELYELAERIMQAGGTPCGEDYHDPENMLHPYRLEGDNYLLTESPEYFHRFIAVSEFCKAQNFMDKAVRKALFQAAMDSASAVWAIKVNYAPVSQDLEIF